MKTWLEHFEHNRTHRLPIPWHLEPRLDREIREPLIRSLQRFQVGESGEGSHLRRQAARAGDPVYQSCIELFVREEQEHSRLMAQLLQQLGAPLLGHHWSDAGFIFLRHLFGLEQELLVLLVPEIIAKRYFRMVRDGTNDPQLRAICGQIMRDEEAHVAFHIAYLREALAHLPLWQRVGLRLVWKILFQGTCAVVLFDHRHLLRALGVSPAMFGWDCTLLFDAAASAIFCSAPDGAAQATGGLLATEQIRA
jgi:hypothetical protein